MTEAYEIGITLALQDGVSDGIAIIRRDLAALDRAIAATSANLAHLHQAEATPPRAPALVLKPLLSLPSQASEPPVASTPAKPQATTGQPATQPAKAPPLAAAPTVTFDLASPSPPSSPVSLPRALPVSTPQTQPLAPPPLDRAPTPVSLPPILPAPAARWTIPAPPVSPPAVFSPLQATATSPVSPLTPTPGNRPQASASPATLAHQPNPPILPHTPTPTSPLLTPPTHPREFPQTQPIAPSPPLFLPVAAPSAPVAPTQQSASTGRPAFPAAPPFQPAPSSNNTPRPDPPASLSYAPPTQAPPPITLQGDITLDGARVGRWMASTLARQAARPAAGPTGPDPRQTPLWSGQAQGY